MLRLILTAILWAASFLLVTQGVGAVPKAAIWLVRLAGVMSLVPLALVARQWRRPRFLDAAVIGGLGLGAVFLMETLYRAQWGPSGAEALFMLSTVPVWVALAALVRRQPGAGMALVAALFVVLANATILANWERPSSFTPFAMFARADFGLLLAAAAFGVGGLEAERRLENMPALGRAAVAGFGATWLILLVPFFGPLTDVTRRGDWTLLLSIGVIGGAALVLAWHEAVKVRGALAASFACGVAPALLSAYTVIERPFGTEHGPVPLVLAPVVAGAVLSLLAAYAGITAARRGSEVQPRIGRPALVLSSLAAAAAFAGMWLPSLKSHIESHLAVSGYSVTWQTLGVSTVGPWLALAAVVAALLAPAGGNAGRLWFAVIAGSAVTVALGGWSLWSAWQGWIPSDVQQALGSPYALLFEYPVTNLFVLAAPWLALSAFATRLFAAGRVAQAREAAGRQAEGEGLARKAARGASILSVVAALTVASGCAQTVAVRSGTLVMCRYGHTISNGIRTLRVPADKASRYRISTVYTVCAQHRRADELMSEAASAAAAGSSADAKRLVGQAFALASDVHDPQGLAAKLGVARPSTAPPGSGKRGAGPTGRKLLPPGGGIVSPTDLMSSIPRSLAGYAFVSENRSDVAATRTFRALSGDPRQLIIQVTYLGAPSAYGSWFAHRVKNRYSVSASTSTIGNRRVYFGTDGRLFATAAWRSDAAAIQVEAAGRGKPLALKPQLMAVVGKLP